MRIEDVPHQIGPTRADAAQEEHARCAASTTRRCPLLAHGVGRPYLKGAAAKVRRWSALAVVGMVAGLGACGSPDQPSAAPCAAVPRAAAASSGPGSARGGPFFAPRSVWNRPLSHDQPLDRRSARLTRALAREASENAGLANGDYGVPLYTVPRHQGCVRVRLEGPGPRNRYLARAFAGVPVPRRAQPAAGSDGHMAVWQPGTDTYWEFFRMRLADDGWRARYGGRIIDVSRSRGYYRRRLDARGRPIEQPGWGATATSLPLAGGLITFDDLRRHRIDHALAIAIPRVLRGVMAAPAQRSDGRFDTPDAIPEGARFRIDPRLNLDRLHLSPLTLMIARAAQRFGMVVRDGGSRVAIYGQAPEAGRDDPYRQVSGGLSRSDALHGFPWDRMQLIRMRLRPDNEP
jgi:hypothetical protein